MSYIKIYKNELSSDDIFAQYAKLPNAIVTGDSITFYTKQQHSIIEDELLMKDLVDTLMEHYEYSREDAMEFSETNASSVVSDMWDANSRFLEDYA